MKQAKVGGIYYGAFETLGSAFEAQKIPVEERNVPIIDLTSLEQLMSWSLAIDRFLGTGDASMVTELAQGAVGPIMKATKGKDEAAKSIKALANVLNHFSANIATCRGIEISSSAKEVQENLARCEEIDLIPPMTPLFTRMKEKFADFGHDDISNGIKAVRWCLQHNMVQQGITILVETLITWVKNLVELGGSEEFSRDMISNAAHFYQTQTAKYEWTGEAQKDPEQTQRLLDKISASPDIAEICKILESIRDYRNDINHAGCRQSPRKAKEFFNQLEKSVSKCDSILNRIKMKPS
jgi:hypothetical protein